MTDDDSVSTLSSDVPGSIGGLRTIPSMSPSPSRASWVSVPGWPTLEGARSTVTAVSDPGNSPHEDDYVTLWISIEKLVASDLVGTSTVRVDCEFRATSSIEALDATRREFEQVATEWSRGAYQIVSAPTDEFRAYHTAAMDDVGWHQVSASVHTTGGGTDFVGKVFVTTDTAAQWQSPVRRDAIGIVSQADAAEQDVLRQSFGHAYQASAVDSWFLSRALTRKSVMQGQPLIQPAPSLRSAGEAPPVEAFTMTYDGDGYPRGGIRDWTDIFCGCLARPSQATEVHDAQVRIHGYVTVDSRNRTP